MKTLPQSRLWRRWGLRRNPFGEPPAEDVPGLVVADLDETYEWWLAGERRALQWIGPSGHGKSAHLFALRQREPGLTQVYLPPGAHIPRLPPTRELLLDEAQRLPRWRRWLLFRRLERLALATHRDLRTELEGAEWQVRTFRVGNLSHACLARILISRLRWAGRREGRGEPATTLEIAALHARYGGHLRALFDRLYELFQDPFISNPWRPAHHG